MDDIEKPRHPYRTLAVISGVFLAAIVGLMAFIMSSDARFKAMLESKGSDRAGRSLTIGNLDIDWGWRMAHVTLNDIHLANAEDLKEPDMVSIKAVDFDIALWKLLIGRTEMSQLTLLEPKLIFEKTDDDTKNWDLPALSSGNAVAESVVPENRHDFPIIGHLQITDGTVIYRDHTKDLNLDLRLNAAQGGDAGKEAGFTLTGTGTLSQKEFKIDANGGSLFALQEKSKPFPLKADITMGATHVTLDGTFEDPIKMEGVNAALKLKGANLADLFYLTTIPFPITPAYDVDGRLKKNGDLWLFQIDQGRVGTSDLAGAGSYDVSGERGFFKASFQSNNLKVKDLGGFIGYAPETKSELPKDKLFPDIPLNVTRLRASDMDVSLNAKKLEAPGLPLQSMNVRFNLDKGLLVVDPLEFGIAGGTGKGDIRVDARSDIPKMDLDLQLRRMDMQDFFNNTRFEAMSGGRFGGRAQITGTGKSLADVLATSNGRLSLLMGGGNISLLIIEASGLDIAQAAPLLLDKDKTTRVRCGVADFTVRNGFLYSDQFIFDTEDTKLEGEAQVDLKQELIQAKVEAHPKDSSPLTARTPLTLSGKLRKPQIGVDPAQLGLKAG
ncbi:MAG TPA: AsmA family protein, partial [Alphaproteobacteria bacterium]